jgi:pimeloyl-ACP methyl ester carboxylesterase
VRRPDLDPTRLPSPTVPTTIVHATTDSIVPIELSHSYVAAHPGVGLTVASEGGHFGLIDPLSPAWPTTAAELARLADAPQLER